MAQSNIPHLFTDTFYVKHIDMLQKRKLVINVVDNYPNFLLFGQSGETIAYIISGRTVMSSTPVGEIKRISSGSGTNITVSASQGKLTLTMPGDYFNLTLISFNYFTLSAS